MRLASLWSDHAVIQRDKQIVVWGWCDAKRTQISATLGPSRAYGATAWDGRFELRLPALSAGGPYDLTVKTANGEEVTVKDILVGEVWLVSGQSNAEFPLKTFNANDPLDQTGQYLSEGGSTPLIRCYTASRDALSAPGDTLAPNSGWKLSSPQTAPDFTAIGAWFALFFHKQFPDIPIGIVHSSWGGSIISAWMSRSALAQTEAGRKLLAMDDEKIYCKTAWASQSDTLERSMQPPPPPVITDYSTVSEADRGNSGYALGYASAEFDDSSWSNMQVPGSWIQQGINTNGATWIRKTIEVPEAWLGQPLELHLGGVDKMDTTYFNDVQIGSMGIGFDATCWSTERVYPVEARTVRAGKNVIAVRGFSFFYDGSLSGNPQKYYLLNTTTGEKIGLCGEDWKASPEYSIEVTAIDQSNENILDYHAVHRLFDNLIHPLIPYALRGVLWYQGESDVFIEERLSNYHERFKSMIREWRYLWGQGEDFPFYFVQLANFQSGTTEAWHRLQDIQRRVFLEVPNTGVITASDLALNEPLDIHPHDKRTFGYRLFQLALANTYGAKDVIPQGPTLDKVRVDGNRLRLHFLYADGMKAKDNQPLRGFSISSDGMNYEAAQAEIAGEEIILFSHTVPTPRHCMYNSNADLPDGNLVNKADLPALSFISGIEG